MQAGLVEADSDKPTCHLKDFCVIPVTAKLRSL